MRWRGSSPILTAIRVDRAARTAVTATEPVPALTEIASVRVNGVEDATVKRVSQ